jgi:hypothetical protein
VMLDKKRLRLGGMPDKKRLRRRRCRWCGQSDEWFKATMSRSCEIRKRTRGDMRTDSRCCGPAARCASTGANWMRG